MTDDPALPVYWKEISESCVVSNLSGVCYKCGPGYFMVYKKFTIIWICSAIQLSNSPHCMLHKVKPLES